MQRAASCGRGRFQVAAVSAACGTKGLYSSRGVFTVEDRDRVTVYYDGECPICTAAADGWRPGAKVYGLELVALQDAPPLEGGPSEEQLRAAIHVYGEGGWLRGAKALQAVYRRLGNRPMAALLTIGIALGLADPVYRLVARHRMHIPLPRRRGRA